MIVPTGGQNPNFDFFHSQVRINIECAFEMLTQRWRILWAPLQCGEHTHPALVVALMKLHNWCINDVTDHISDSQPLFQNFGEEEGSGAGGDFPPAPAWRTQRTDEAIPSGDAALPALGINRGFLGGGPCHVALPPVRQTRDVDRNRKRTEIIEKLEELQLRRPIVLALAPASGSPFRNHKNIKRGRQRQRGRG